MLGFDLALPFLLAPVGYSRLMHSGVEVAATRAASGLAPSSVGARMPMALPHRAKPGSRAIEILRADLERTLPAARLSVDCRLGTDMCERPKELGWS